MLMHGVQTQGVRSKLRENYISLFAISYSLDQETWTTYRGNSTRQKYVCLLSVTVGLGLPFDSNKMLILQLLSGTSSSQQINTLFEH